MADKQQPHLNGAYYRPSIPPPEKIYHRPARRSSGCCRGCCCLLSLLCKLLATIVFVAAIAGVLFWLIFRPIDKVSLHVTVVTLTQFNLTNSNKMLNYDLALNVTIRNPNRKIGIYYDVVGVTGLYKGQRFGSQVFGPFYQGHRNTTILNPVLKGQNVVDLGSDGLREFNKETTAGVYDIDLEIKQNFRFKLGIIKTPRGWYNPGMTCGLRIPVNGNGQWDSGAVTNQCSLEYSLVGLSEHTGRMT